jgi:biofilm PGA synthesis N-glycosyltransferase PgaC
MLAFLMAVFWSSCFIFFYNYAGYAVLLYFLNRLQKPEQSAGRTGELLPSVSFIVAAYNEADCIGQKIANSLALDYPAGALEFIFITDGSTDNTPDLVREFPAIRLLHLPERKGKSAALNRAVTEARHDILIFSDANTQLNSDVVQYIVRHYHNPDIGGVAGEKIVLPSEPDADEVSAGEGLYWKYESALKRLDSRFYSVVGAAGELFSLRKCLFEPLPENIILDDFVLSLKVAQKGYRIIYEPGACARELPSFSLGDEQKRKIRIAAGGFQAMLLLTPLLAFWKHPRLSFLYISHRVLRWTLSPLCLILAFLSGGVLCFLPGAPLLYKVLFILQLGIYIPGILASLFPTIQQRSKWIKLCYYFLFMNTSVIAGFFRFLRGHQTATWEKARRAPAPSQNLH